MKYSEWNPEVHTMQDDPCIGLTYAWNQYMRLRGAKWPKFVIVGQDLFDAYAAMDFAPVPMREDVAGIKQTSMITSKQPGWGFEFSNTLPSAA